MCTSNKRQNQQHVSNTAGILKNQAAKTVNRADSGSGLVTPVVCASCRTLHYTRSLACKKCGDYFHKQHQQVGPRSRSWTGAAVVVGSLIGVAGVLAMMVM
jgi:hypothetical protein